MPKRNARLVRIAELMLAALKKGQVVVMIVVVCLCLFLYFHIFFLYQSVLSLCEIDYDDFYIVLCDDTYFKKQDDEEVRGQIVDEGVFYHTYKEFPVKEPETVWTED